MKTKAAFEAWLRRIVVNVALQYLHAQKRLKNAEIGAVDSTMGYEWPEESASADMLSFSEAELWHAIASLPEHHRLVFHLYAINNFTHAQIGSQLGISEGTSKSHLARARKRIRELLRHKETVRKERRKAWLWLLPYPLWDIDSLCKRQLANLELPPQQPISWDSVDFGDVSPLSKPAPLYFTHYTPIGISVAAVVVGLGFISFLDFTAPPKHTPQTAANVQMTLARLSAVSDSVSDKHRTFSFSAPKTATFSKKDIMRGETTKQSENMKMVSILGAALMAGSALAFDSASPLKIEPIDLKNKDIAANAALPSAPKITDSAKSSPKKRATELSGTFYADKLFWSSVNNELFLKGVVKVHLNTQKFGGIGTFSFINKIDHIVVEGTPMQLNQTLQLTKKKYYLKELSEAEAVSKYGENAKVVIEITVAE
ncbi:MAG: sigma-70 family RNA polymerase sigma factor [Spirosomataceae bacterium]